MVGMPEMGGAICQGLDKSASLTDSTPRNDAARRAAVLLRADEQGHRSTKDPRKLYPQPPFLGEAANSSGK
jgi:hypothetical protein